MYLEIPQGSTVNIQGLDCHLPPEGYVWNIVTKQLEYRGIYQRSNKPEEQYWERFPLPPWYKQVIKAEEEYEKRKRPEDGPFYDERYEEFKRQEWDRRLNGFWLMIKGKAVYLVGMHYTYLQWWSIDIGYPKFRFPDLEYFYFLLYCIEDPDCMGMLEITKRRFGKCFSKNTPIRMYDGSIKNVQDVVDGDFVMGNDSTPRTVCGVTSGAEMMYRITPKRGEPFECNSSHILSLKWNGVVQHSKYGWEKNGTVNISVEEYIKLKDWEKEHLCLYKSGWGNHFNEAPHIIPPYILGVYLGDGCKTFGHITTTDSEVLKEVEEFAASMNLNCNRTKGIGNEITYRLSQKGVSKNDDGVSYLKNWSTNPYRDELRRLNILNNKHIPKEYIIDIEKNRYEVLAGLLDTDGHLITVKGRHHGYEITQKIERIANDIVELARSLGFYVSKKSKNASMVREDGTVYNCNVFRVSIFGEIDKIPCRIKRKKADKLSRRSNCMRTGFSVESIGYGEYFGFAVDGNHLFLLKDGIVVHNTFRGGLFLVEYVTRTKMTNAGIQSKTGGDAKKVFSKAVVGPFKKLPKFFRPEYDMSLGITPKTEMRFQQTNIRGRKAEEGLGKDELESMLDWQSADTIAYDGQKIHRGFNDEWAKTVEVNIYDRHDVLRYCVVDDEGKIIGKLLYSSTVEKLDTEKDGVQEAAKKLWDDSNQNDRKENGRTASGLYRFFMTADRGRNFDIYGEPDIEKTIKEITADRASVSHNLRALSARIRKEARTIEEAFSTDSDKCIFNVVKIDQRVRELTEKPIAKRTVVFYRDLDQIVRWRDVDPKNSSFHWKITAFPPPGQENKFVLQDGKRKPGRTDDGAIAIDGYSNSQGGQKWGSKASAWIGRKFDILDPYNTGKAIGHLYGRPSVKDILYEQVLLASEHYGYISWFEHNSDSYLEYFRDRGRILYLGTYPLSTIDPTKRENADRWRGFPTTPFSLAKQADTGMAYVEDYCHLIDYLELLEDMKVFDPNNRTEFDITVSFLMLLVCLMEPTVKPPPRRAPLVTVYENPNYKGN